MQNVETTLFMRIEKGRAVINDILVMINGDVRRLGSGLNASDVFGRSFTTSESDSSRLDRFINLWERVEKSWKALREVDFMVSQSGREHVVVAEGA